MVRIPDPSSFARRNFPSTKKGFILLMWKRVIERLPALDILSWAANVHLRLLNFPTFPPLFCPSWRKRLLLWIKIEIGMNPFKAASVIVWLIVCQLLLFVEPAAVLQHSASSKAITNITTVNDMLVFVPRSFQQLVSSVSFSRLACKTFSWLVTHSIQHTDALNQL